MKKNHILCLLLFTLSLAAISLSKNTADNLRNNAVLIVSPFWQTIAKAKTKLQFSFESIPEDALKELHYLKLENQQLKNDIYKSSQLIHDAITLGKAIPKSLQQLEVINSAIRNRQSLLENKLNAQPANVIYRPPTTWSSSLWIDQGSKYNKELGKVVIAKNSPVVVAGALIGVIDYVGDQQSRVRLITDSNLSISVRVARGALKNQRLSDSLDLLLMHIATQREPIFKTVQEQRAFLQQLKRWQKSLLESEQELLLAKGEIYGSSLPFWRSRGQLLKGVGFNYDFDDEEGPARDLRTAIPYGARSNTTPIKLLEIGDLLVTTGMDGVFPFGLPVAEVIEVGKLKEGDYSYELIAKPIAGDLESLSIVYVLPPIGFTNEES